MMTILFPLALVTIVTLFTLSVLAVVASRHAVLQPTTVDPFSAPRISDPSSDTLAGWSEMVKTVLTPPNDWHVTTLHNLSEVEDLLDSLEAHGIHHREVVTLSEDCFAVRWK